MTNPCALVISVFLRPVSTCRRRVDNHFITPPFPSEKETFTHFFPSEKETFTHFFPSEKETFTHFFPFQKEIHYLCS